jgi:prenyltransferase beta subunit
MLVFVCTATLAILDRLDEVDEDMLSWWLAERQLPNGGLNGRPKRMYVSLISPAFPLPVVRFLQRMLR